MISGRSIRLRLIVMLTSTILLVWLVVLVLVYLVAEHEVEEVFDANLAQNAHILQALLLHEVEEELNTAEKVREVTEELGASGLSAYPRLAALLRQYTSKEGKEQVELFKAAQDAGIKYNSGTVFIARYGDGTQMMRGGPAPDLPVSEDGYSNVSQQGRKWRTFNLTDKATGFIVQVGERQAFRTELVRYITRNTMTPLLLALPIIGFLIWAVVGHALASLQRVVRSVSMRAPDALDPIADAETPKEIESLLNALNALFERVGAAIVRERQFTADAAHELRTPLAGLKTRLQVARSQSLEPATQHSLDLALAGVDRATHTVEQLLALARADAEQAKAMISVAVNLREIAVQLVSAFSQQAVDRNIDLGVEAPAGVWIRGDATALQMLLRNLLDNALRYTPPGGVVTVAAGQGADGSWIEVADSGVGVAVEQRKNILHRFHRGTREETLGAQGSGLGLSIVQRIADLHGAKVLIGDGLNGKGLGVKVIFRTERLEHLKPE